MITPARRSIRASPIRCAQLPDLTEVVVRTGHWMAQENPVAVNAALARWIATKLPSVWPGSGDSK
jgi:pimeloyl-ACP methyl ester carboxylesterase